MKPSTKRWLEKAEGDRRVALREAAADGSIYDAVCFHAQQCVEKYLKAILEEAGIPSPKSHDLILLHEKAKAVCEGLELDREELATLSFYSVDVRYPDGGADPEDARQAIEIMERCRERIRACLK